MCVSCVCAVECTIIYCCYNKRLFIFPTAPSLLPQACLTFKNCRFLFSRLFPLLFPSSFLPTARQRTFRNVLQAPPACSCDQLPQYHYTVALLLLLLLHVESAMVYCNVVLRALSAAVAAVLLQCGCVCMYERCGGAQLQKQITTHLLLQKKKSFACATTTATTTAAIISNSK
jgi:hypothetical protein